MHRDHLIPADDRTKFFWLFGCSLTPIASSPSTATGNLVSMESLVEYLFPSQYSGAEYSATYE